MLRAGCAEASAQPARASAQPPLSPPYVCICIHLHTYRYVWACSGRVAPKLRRNPPELRRKPPQTLPMCLFAPKNMYVWACNFSVRSSMLHGGGADSARSFGATPPSFGATPRRMLLRTENLHAQKYRYVRANANIGRARGGCAEARAGCAETSAQPARSMPKHSDMCANVCKYTHREGSGGLRRSSGGLRRRFGATRPEHFWACWF